MATKEIKRASEIAEKTRIIPSYQDGVAMARCNEADKFTPLSKGLTEKKQKELEKLKKAVKEKK